MFTGIIEAVGRIESMDPKGGDMRLRIHTADLDMSDVKLGDSIAVSGVCLTAAELGSHDFTADVSGETLARTTLGKLKINDKVNLEKALTPTTRLGGHLVSGHVDGVGEVISREGDARSIRFRIRPPKSLSRYIAEKGSICIDGISLTVNHIDDDAFDLNIVPHTLVHTTMDEFRPGRKVNLEVDVIARYLERLLLGGDAARDSGVSLELLRKSGFIDK
ncbi:MAG: riboflavin synthase subunit alpha [Acidithiobacillales bacterium SG8_45]|jgi:riboflavin synthase|nr:MAG: riboflavin synthase subunit alpha [Acidithiobacillales bacterium SG8_45]